MRTLRSTLALALVAVTVCTAPGEAEAQVQVPAEAQAQVQVAVVRHAGHFWVWFGPRPWTASYGTHGITVQSRSGLDVLDLAFSSTTCAAGASWPQSAAAFFRGRRRSLTDNGLIIERTSRIVRPAHSSALYRRQIVFARINSGGTVLRGSFTFDYDYSTSITSAGTTVNYCYQRSLGEYAPATRWPSTRRTLLRVQRSLNYSGPGVAKGNGVEDPTRP